MFSYPEIVISIFEDFEKVEQIRTTIPCSLYNLCTPVNINREVITDLKDKKVMKTDKLPLNP